MFAQIRYPLIFVVLLHAPFWCGQQLAGAQAAAEPASPAQQQDAVTPLANYQTAWLRLQYPTVVADGHLAIVRMELLGDCQQPSLQWLNQQPLVLPLSLPTPNLPQLADSTSAVSCLAKPANSADLLPVTVQQKAICAYPAPTAKPLTMIPIEKALLAMEKPLQRQFHVWLPTPLGQKPGSYPLLIACNGIELQIPLEVVEGRYPVSILQVDPKFTKPPPPRTIAEQQQIQQAFAQGTSLPLWHQSFVRPSQGPTSSIFGVRRLYNHKTTGRHRGLDIAGAIGEPIVASNDGVVVLAADDFFFIGNAVLIDHGAQLFSMYFHLDSKQVKQGDKVQRGQQIGTLGKTGRVTGPHLHVAFKLGQTYIDPLDVLAYVPGASQPAPPATLAGNSNTIQEEEGL